MTTTNTINSFPKFLSKADEGKLLIGFALARRETGFTKEEGEKLTTWAEWIAFSATMLRLAIEGKIAVNMSHADIATFSDINFVSVLGLVGPSAAEEYIKQLKTIDARYGPSAGGTEPTKPGN